MPTAFEQRLTERISDKCGGVACKDTTQCSCRAWATERSPKQQLQQNDHLTVLECEAVDADWQVCPECGDVGPNDTLLRFTTVRCNGAGKHRKHAGLFCSKQCHDIWHGLTSYSQLAKQDGGEPECPKCGLLGDHRYPCVG
jgi:hypothetical protein